MSVRPTSCSSPSAHRASAPRATRILRSCRAPEESHQRLHALVRERKAIERTEDAQVAIGSVRAELERYASGDPRREDQRAVTARAGATAARSSSARASSSGSGLLKK